MTTGGYTCAVCGAWVPNGTLHSCGRHPWTYPFPPTPPTPAPLQAGWVCPSCNAGVAPFMPYCPHCKPAKRADVDVTSTAPQPDVPGLDDPT